MIFLAEKDGKHVWNKSKCKWKINSFGEGGGARKGKLAKDRVSYFVLCFWRDFDNP